MVHSITRSLTAIPLFAGLDVDQCSALSNVVQRRLHGPKDVIWRQGDIGDALYVVISGYVKGERLARNGTDTVVCITGPGEIFGELSAFEGSARAATMSALHNTETVILDREHILALTATSPQFATELLKHMAMRLRELTDRYEAVSSMPVAAKLATALMLMARRFGVAQDRGIAIPFQLTQHELGSFSGVARENVNKLLRMWAGLGLLKYSSGQLALLRPEVLQEFAQPH